MLQTSENCPDDEDMLSSPFASSSSTPEHDHRVSPADSHDYSWQAGKRGSVVLAPTSKREMYFAQYASAPGGSRHSAPDPRSFVALVTDFGSWPREPQAEDTVMRPPLPPHPHPDDVVEGMHAAQRAPFSQDKMPPRAPPARGEDSAADFRHLAARPGGGGEGLAGDALPPLPAAPPPPRGGEYKDAATGLPSSVTFGTHVQGRRGSRNPRQQELSGGCLIPDGTCASTVFRRGTMGCEQGACTLQAPKSDPLPGTLTPDMHVELLAQLLAHPTLVVRKPSDHSPLQSPDFDLSPDSRSSSRKRAEGSLTMIKTLEG